MKTFEIRYSIEFNGGVAENKMWVSYANEHEAKQKFLRFKSRKAVVKDLISIKEVDLDNKKPSCKG